MEIFEPFMFEGYISFVGDLTKPVPIKILRDTGASQSIVLAGEHLFLRRPIRVLVFFYWE